VTTPNEITEEAEQVDIGDLCSRTLSALTPMIEARRLSVAVDIDRAATVLAPPAHAAILVRNLLDNAVRYATPGGRISVSLLPSPRNKYAHLHVYNDYPTPDSLELDRLFEPFYRADISRSSATGGNGLGLAICNRIARRHGWSLLIGRETDGICIDAAFSEERDMRD
jgi:signal transduction histidine kinase